MSSSKKSKLVNLWETDGGGEKKRSHVQSIRIEKVETFRSTPTEAPPPPPPPVPAQIPAPSPNNRPMAMDIPDVKTSSQTGTASTNVKAMVGADRDELLIDPLYHRPRATGRRVFSMTPQEETTQNHLYTMDAFFHLQRSDAEIEGAMFDRKRTYQCHDCEIVDLCRRKRRHGCDFAHSECKEWKATKTCRNGEACPRLHPGYVETRIKLFISELLGHTFPCHAAVIDYMQLLLYPRERHTIQRADPIERRCCDPAAPFRESIWFDWDHPDNKLRPYRRTRQEKQQFPRPSNVARPAAGHGSREHRPVLILPLLDRFGILFDRADVSIFDVELILHVEDKSQTCASPTDEARPPRIVTAKFTCSTGNTCVVEWSGLSVGPFHRYDSYVRFNPMHPWHVELTQGWPKRFRDEEEGAILPWPTAVLATILSALRVEPESVTLKQEWRFSYIGQPRDHKTTKTKSK